ncbi:hypothetical protein [Capnocytophaga sp.]|nr:hypothetical protein [Capnocytophaga sp.]MDO5106467.1 hypothetical protein [Capnocytophaga sp.]
MKKHNGPSENYIKMIKKNNKPSIFWLGLYAGVATGVIMALVFLLKA